MSILLPASPADLLLGLLTPAVLTGLIAAPAIGLYLLTGDRT